MNIGMSMTMTPEAKIWRILQKIDDAIAIAPSGEPVFVDIKDLEKKIPREEQEQIFTKLAKDHQLFEIQKKPDYKSNFRYQLQITDADLFRAALNEAHIKHFGSLEMLTGDNFFSVVDVAADIMNQLQMTMANEVTIPLLPSIVRFSSLMPADSINLRDDYCSHRWKAIGYLKNNNHIEDFVLNRDGAFHRWEQTITIIVDRTKFTKFYERLMDVYKKRVRFPDKETENKTATTIPELPTQKVEIIGGQIKAEIEGLEKGLSAIAKTNEEEKKNKFPYKLPAGTEWKNFIIQFLNKEEVYIQVNRFKHNENYAKMGFADNRFSVPKPNEGWTFLWVLAKYNGELTIKDPDAKDTYKKQKELVSKALKSYFSMESDPFYPYQETKSYKTRFTLLPPPKESEEKGKKYQIPQTEVEQDSVDEEIRQYFEEQAPQVYDDKQGW